MKIRQQKHQIGAWQLRGDGEWFWISHPEDSYPTNRAGYDCSKSLFSTLRRFTHREVNPHARACTGESPVVIEIDPGRLAESYAGQVCEPSFRRTQVSSMVISLRHARLLRKELGRALAEARAHR